MKRGRSKSKELNVSRTLSPPLLSLQLRARDGRASFNIDEEREGVGIDSWSVRYVKKDEEREREGERAKIGDKAREREEKKERGRRRESRG